jgi:hypothetical protein
MIICDDSFCRFLFAELAAQLLSISDRRRDVRMSQPILYVIDAFTAFDKVRGKAMP